MFANYVAFTNECVIILLKGEREVAEMSTFKTFGYGRVSTKEQNEDRQVYALVEAGVKEEDIFIDKQSGKSFDRPQYQTLLSRLRKNDTIIIQSIDRLGRNYTAILQEWEKITQEKEVNIKVLDMPLLDTTISEENLDGQFISKLVLQILSYVAEKERVNIQIRQRQGIERAKAQGKRLGRPSLGYPTGFVNTYKDWKDDKITAKAAMELLGLKKTSFYKLVKEYEASVKG